MTKLVERIKELRKAQTDAEKLLWSQIRNRTFLDYKFRRQYQLGYYIVDFVCFERKLIIELDGSQHLEQAEYDIERTAFLNSLGFKVIRFWNHEVHKSLMVVLDKIAFELENNKKTMFP